MDGKPFRDDNDQLVFRPGGHGALIDNLNKLQADVIFIKNIDNVIQNHIQEVALYKKALAGKLTLLQESIFDYLKILDIGLVSENNLSEIIHFISSNLKSSKLDKIYIEKRLFKNNKIRIFIEFSTRFYQVYNAF